MFGYLFIYFFKKGERENYKRQLHVISGQSSFLKRDKGKSGFRRDNFYSHWQTIISIF